MMRVAYDLDRNRPPRRGELTSEQQMKLSRFRPAPSQRAA
jgi:hypothetical protein